MEAIIAAIVLGILTGIWRYHDGRDEHPTKWIAWGYRWRSSSAYSIPLCLAAGLCAYGPWVYDLDRIIGVGLIVVVTWRLLLNGFKWPKLVRDKAWFQKHKGWDSLIYMAWSRALPTLIVGAAFGLYFQSWISIFYAASGLMVASVYVLSSQYVKSYMEANDRQMPLMFGTRLHWGYAGEISHGAFVFGLALL